MHLIKKEYRKDELDEALIMFPGILSSILFNQNYFKKNSEVKDFVKEIFCYEYKNYLFQSRTILYARIIKDVIKEKDNSKQLALINSLCNFVVKIEKTINSNVEIENNILKVKNKKNTIQKDLTGWINVIKS